MMGCTCRADSLRSHFPTLLTGYDLHFAGLISHAPHHMVLMTVRLAAHALTLTIHKEFHFVCLIIITPHVYLLTRQPVPVGKKMKHPLLVIPLTLIHIVNIFGEARQIDDAEITTAGWESVRCGLADIVEACPDKLSAHIRRMLHHLPCLLMGTAPGCTHVVISTAHE